MLNVCVPVLKRYDMLAEMLRSLQSSTVPVDEVYVIDNGRDDAGLLFAADFSKRRFKVHTPDHAMGVAESWNWFINNVPEERIIVNDDVQFAPDSIAKLVGSKADLVWAEGVGFSCFVIRDACVKKLGLFDETISPGYGYYEDEDYLQRLDGRGTRPPSAIAENVACGVVHAHSATLKAGNEADVQEHHRKFKIAQANYMRKWGIESL